MIPSVTISADWLAVLTVGFSCGLGLGVLGFWCGWAVWSLFSVMNLPAD